MPSIGRIQSTNFQALLTSLGITRNNIPFDLRSEVTPVVLVGGTVSFVAAATPPYRVADIFTEGVLNNPADGTVLADTGQLPVGAYSVQVIQSSGEGNNFMFEWRNAGNTANLWAQDIRPAEAASPRVFIFSTRLEILTPNERFRFRTDGASAAVDYQATILARV